MLAQPTQQFTKGMIIPMEGTGAPIRFQWNPQTIKHDKSVEWAQLKPIGREQPILQFAIGSAQAISFQMDVSEPGGSGMAAKDYINQIIELTKPSVGQNVKRPPKVKLIFGQNLRITCVITSVGVTYGPLYDPESLGPQQAKVNITFLEFK